MKPLSKSQLQQLGIAATAAFKRLDQLDLLELPADVATCSKSARMEFWRQRECASITPFCSFRDLTNDLYLKVKTHFEKIAGIESKASNESSHWLREMWQWAKQAGLGPGYIATVCKNRRFPTQLDQLDARQAKQLHDTIVNRARAKLGLGEVKNRNKKQRRTVTREAIADTNIPF
jgi:hypothetical protein